MKNGRNTAGKLTSDNHPESHSFDITNKTRGGLNLNRFPDLLVEWDYSKNKIDPAELHPGTTKKVHWKCKNGHSYVRRIRSQTTLGVNCPECKSFGYLYPEKAKEWHPTKNTESPNQVSHGSNKKVWWKCETGHEWEATVSSRRKHGCPYCAGIILNEHNSFATMKPELVKYWDYKKNSRTPSDVTWHTNKKFSFICEKGHSFSSNLNNISNGKWCPYCRGGKAGYGNSLHDLNPILANEWHPSKNKKSAREITPGSSKKAWWICSKGHEWQATTVSRNTGNGCPYCSNRYVGYGNSLAERFPELLSEINYKKNNIDPFKIVAFSEKSIWWICKFGHEWKAPIRRRTTTRSGCRFCSSQTSSPEIRVFTELKAVFGVVLGRERIRKIEVDILIPKLKIAVEYDGSYYHQNKESKDLEKRNKLLKLGYRVFRLRELPLETSDDDVKIKPGHDAPSKTELNQLFVLIAKLNPEVSEKCTEYIKRRDFIASREYKRILSYLPGPPEEDSLAELYPSLSKEWNFKKNHPLKPRMFHPRSGKKVWWRCNKGHEWESTIDKRAGSGRGCPYCTNKKVGYGNSLADKFPEISKMWYQEGNGEITPNDVTYGSGMRVWWQCENGHIYKARVVDKTTKGGQCRYCPGIGRSRKYIQQKITG